MRSIFAPVADTHRAALSAIGRHVLQGRRPARIELPQMDSRQIVHDHLLELSACGMLSATAARRARPHAPWEPFPRPASPASRRPAWIGLDQREALAARPRFIGTFAGKPFSIQASRASNAARATAPQSSSQLAGGHRRRPNGTGCLSAALAGHSHRNDVSPFPLTAMDRIYLALIVAALALFIGAAGVYITRTAGIMPHARTISASPGIDRRETPSGGSHGRYETE